MRLFQIFFLSFFLFSCASKNNTNEVSELLCIFKTSASKSDLSEQIKTLNDLYKEGALTKEEFEKAKKKLLN